MTFRRRETAEIAALGGQRKTSWRRTASGGLAILAFMAGAAACNRNPVAQRQHYMDLGNRYFQEKRYGEAIIEYKNALKGDSTYGEGNYRLGLALLQQGRWGPAADSFSNVIKYSPDNLDARLRLGSIETAGGQYAEAGEQAQEVLNRDSQNASAHLLLGQIQLQQKNFKNADEEFRRASELAPNEAVAYGNMGLAELLNGDYEAAEKNFQRAKELNPKDPQYVVNWANFYRSRQKPERAEQILQQAMTENPTAIEIPFALADLYVYEGRTEDAKRLLDRTAEDSKHYEDPEPKVADFYYLHNDAEAALGLYVPLAQKHPSDKSLVESIVLCYLQLGSWADAERWLDKENKNERDSTYEILRARVYIGEYRMRDAISNLQAVLRNDTGNILAHYYLAQADLKGGDPEGAKAELVGVLELQPGYISALLGLGDLSLQKNDPGVALEYANQIITQSYWMVDAHLLAGNAYILRGNLRAALKEFQIAKSLTPHRPQVEERVGRVLAAEGQYGEAEKAYEDALNTDPGYGLALGGLAESLVARGQTDRAFARINEQVERQPGFCQLHLVRGEFCLTQGNWDCAEQSFQKAIEMNEYDVSGYVGLARLYSAMKRKDDALTEVESAQAKFPEFLPTYIQHAQLLEQREEFERAKEVYRQALQVNSNYVAALNGLAWMYCEHNGPLDEALELAQRAKKQAPDDPHVNDTLAWIYYKQGLYPSAVGLLESAVASDPKNPIFDFHLGIVYLSLGKPDQARRTLQTALRSGLNPEDARAAKQALQKAGA
jgi:tetratricopeptide (TPR) repeat protein